MTASVPAVPWCVGFHHLILAILMSAACTHAASYPAPRIRDSSDFGHSIQRTMNLIANSTAAKPATVKIMVYGQSWSKQEWNTMLAAWLEETYPTVDFVFHNPSIGGCASNCLQRPAERDIRGFYPDLLIFHVGITDNASYGSILASARRNTACELMLWNDYYPAGSNESASLQKDIMGPKYHAEVVDSWQGFQDYLSDNGIGADKLHDGHLTEWGSYVLFELIKAHFVYRPDTPTDPHGLVKTYHVGTDASFQDGALQLRFAGNRIDAVADLSAGGPYASLEVLIDGKKPSEYGGCYVATRPNGHLGQDWMNEPIDWRRDWPWYCGGMYTVRWVGVPTPQEWTATIKNLNMGSNYFEFDLRGSVTGLDGSGTNKSTYSGSMLIEPGDWVLPTSDYWIDAYDFALSNGYEVTWKIERRHIDTYVPPPSADIGKEQATTLSQGLPNNDHTLELRVKGEGAVPIRALRVYRPLVDRPQTTVPDPKPVAVVPRPRRPPVSRRATAAQTFDLHGRRLAPGSGHSGRSLMLKIESLDGRTCLVPDTRP